MKFIRLKNLLILITTALISSCSGDKAFYDYARAGDTVVIATGWKQNFNRENITVTITPSSGPDIIMLPGNPAIRASINFYPDPLSSAIISRETNMDITRYAQTYAQVLSSNFTNDDKDWYQTTVFIDLPQSLPTGTTQIMISNQDGAYATSNVEIIHGLGSPSTFTAENHINLTPDMLDAFSRVKHYTIDFSGPNIPYAIEITLTHDADITAGGEGKAYAVNPLGYKKNLHWTDNGYAMKAILLPVTNTALDNFNDFKFYIAGDIINLGVYSVAAYDIYGNNVANVSALSKIQN